MAFDTIMVFPDQFKKHILPEQIHVLNVAFLVPEMRREFGGCAGNIAYNLHMLGGSPRIMATVGEDFDVYRRRLQERGMDLSHIRTIPDSYTAQAFITTDLDDNQITAFHPGAMAFAHENHIGDARDIKLGIVSPDGREGMIQHVREFHEAGIPFVFDPGQGMPMFSGDELKNLIDQADYVSVNDYEGRMLAEKTGLSLAQVASRVKALIVTLGGQGSVIYADGKEYHIPVAKADAVIDPTGCGDAYRAGLLYGIVRGMDWQMTGRLASLLGAIKIASRGGQNHVFTPDEIADRFKVQYGTSLA